MISSTLITVIHPGEQLTMAAHLRTGTLRINRSGLLPMPTVLDIGGFELDYDTLEIVGAGIFELRQRGRVLLWSSAKESGDVLTLTSSRKRMPEGPES